MAVLLHNARLVWVQLDPDSLRSRAHWSKHWFWESVFVDGPVPPPPTELHGYTVVSWSFKIFFAQCLKQPCAVTWNGETQRPLAVYNFGCLPPENIKELKTALKNVNKRNEKGKEATVCGCNLSELSIILDLDQNGLYCLQFCLQKAEICLWLIYIR